MKTAKRKRLTNLEVKEIKFTDIEGNEHLLSQVVDEDLIVFEHSGETILLDVENAVSIMNYLKKVLSLVDFPLN
jgi:hypothetical protein